MFFSGRSREACALVASKLVTMKISAKAYHAGLKGSERDSGLYIYTQLINELINKLINFSSRGMDGRKVE